MNVGTISDGFVCKIDDGQQWAASNAFMSLSVILMPRW